MSKPDTVAPADSMGKLGVVLTGGTIAATLSAGSVGPALVVASAGGRRTPERAVLEAALQSAAAGDATIVQPMAELSENLMPADWLRIAETVRVLVEREGARGVLILHGTDTMAYTAAALSFLLADLRVPIVLSGSNLPATDPRSDAAGNIAVALTALAWLVDGVYIAFAGSGTSPGWVHVGTRVRKLRASGPAFASINRRPAGKVVDGAYVPIDPLRREPRLPVAAALDDRVFGLRVYPGLDFQAISDMLEAGEFAGVVLELYASATAPVRSGRHSAVEFVRRCRAAGMAVIAAVAAAPAAAGRSYETTVQLREAGAVFVGDMLPETALVKLMWALPQAGRAEAVASAMLDAVAEELRVSR